MKATSIQVPGCLLFHAGLSPSAKLLWMIHKLCTQTGLAPITPGLLQRAAGLSWHTVRHHLDFFQTRGLLYGQRPGIPGTRGRAALPTALLLDRRIAATGKLLYGALGLTPEMLGETTRATWADLAALTGLGFSTVKRAAQALQSAGWLTMAQRTKFAPVQFSLCNPLAEEREAEALAAERRIDRAEHKCEALMREFLSLIVASRDFEDNATPGFLINPFTDEELQFDRFYMPDVAYEYNGPQHDGPTERYPDELSARRQRGRDLLKKAICAERGITLVVVRLEDLTLESMLKLTQGLLPLRPLDGHEPLIRVLQKKGTKFRAAAARGSGAVADAALRAGGSGPG